MIEVTNMRYVSAQKKQHRDFFGNIFQLSRLLFFRFVAKNVQLSRVLFYNFVANIETSYTREREQAICGLSFIQNGKWNSILKKYNFVQKQICGSLKGAKLLVNPIWFSYDYLPPPTDKRG